MEFTTLLAQVGEVGLLLYQKGMHPSASGNISVWIDPTIEITETYEGDWKPLDEPLPRLARMRFLVTASGCQIKFLLSEPNTTMGVVEINEDGTKYRKIYGFSGGEGNPTSEFISHLKLQAIGNPGAIIHCHPPYINALMLAGVIRDDFTANQVIWCGTTECVVYIAGGVRFVPWCVPGGLDIATKTAAGFEAGANAVLWDRHGLIAKGGDIRSALGTVESIDNAAEHCQMALAATGEILWLPVKNLDELSAAFKGKVPAPNEYVHRLLVDDEAK